jgi:hypothetical protein
MRERKRERERALLRIQVPAAPSAHPFREAHAAVLRTAPQKQHHNSPLLRPRWLFIPLCGARPRQPAALLLGLARTLNKGQALGDPQPVPYSREGSPIIQRVGNGLEPGGSPYPPTRPADINFIRGHQPSGAKSPGLFPPLPTPASTDSKPGEYSAGSAERVPGGRGAKYVNNVQGTASGSRGVRAGLQGPLKGKAA